MKNRYLSSAYYTRLLIVGLDLLVGSISFYLAALLRFDFHIPDFQISFVYSTMVLIGIMNAIFFKVFRTYSGIIRFTSKNDIKRIVYAVLLTSVLLSMFRMLGGGQRYFLVSHSINIIYLVITSVVLIGMRLSIRLILRERRISGNKKEATSIVVYGAGELGFTTIQTIMNDPDHEYNVVRVFDDNPGMERKSIEGIPVFTSKRELVNIFESNNVKKAIIAINNLTRAKKNEFVNLCLEHGVEVMSIPPVSDWVNGKLNVSQISNINIEDLLSRPSIKIDRENISREVQGKTVLVTGAAGSIGSEIAKQLLSFYPHTLILLDIAETPLVNLELDIKENFNTTKGVKTIVCDIRDKKRLEYVFDNFRPGIVYHAAAYKHVPMMEWNPTEAIKVNVLGTKNVMDLSSHYQVDKVVMVSTDKAVNPTNVMGATKRIAEIYVQALNRRSETAFVTTRFGNVLGSNGSVIPRFKNQIEHGGPVTITHPEITRYFMTIPEACQLVLEAGAMGNGGEVMLFDMGQPVRILDLAKKMIMLCGLEPDKDVKIEFTGLRPGEKLFEELLHDKEKDLPTHHEKIKIASVNVYTWDIVNKFMLELKEASRKNDDFECVFLMKKLVSDYTSNNSRFEVVDRKIDNSSPTDLSKEILRKNIQ